jgi:hypothetical protein
MIRTRTAECEATDKWITRGGPVNWRCGSFPVMEVDGVYLCTRHRRRRDERRGR